MSCNSCANRKKVFVIYYSTYGHVLTLAREVLKGLQNAGVDAYLFQVPETLPSEVLEKMHAPPKPEDVPIIQACQLPQADGFIFGVPTRFGMLPAQMKAFFDSCGQLWMKGALTNKFVGTFFSTGILGGGQESTTLSMIPFFAHMGMTYVSLGGKAFQVLKDATEPHGGSNYGAGTFAGLDGKRQVSDLEKKVAEIQGFDFGNVVK